MQKLFPVESENFKKTQLDYSSNTRKEQTEIILIEQPKKFKDSYQF